MASPLEALKRLFSGVRGEGSVLGIDIGSSSAKIVQLRSSKGVAILETYGEIALAPYAKIPIGKSVKLPPEQTAEALLDLMREANVTGQAGGMSIPFSSSLVTILELPKTDKEQLARMIPIEARKYIPVPISEITLDWFAIPGEETPDAFDRVEEKVATPARGQEVLVAAIHNEVLRNYQAVAQNAALSITFYEIEVFSTIRACLGRGVAPILILDIGASTSKIYVVERGIVRASHLVTTGGMHMTEQLARSLQWDFEKAERVKREIGILGSRAYSSEENQRIQESLLSTLTRLFSEGNRVLLSYGKRYNKNVSHVVLTGGGSSLLGIQEEAKKAFGVDVEVADPFSRTEAPAFLTDVLREIGPSFGVAVGLALRDLKHQG